MHIAHCKDQGSNTIESQVAGHYQNDNSGDGPAMLSLLARLRAVPDERRVFAITSHYKVCLHSEDSYQSPVFVAFVAVSGNYYVEYRVPPELAPWPNAWTNGVSRSEDEAVLMILKAMDLSAGWNNAG